MSLTASVEVTNEKDFNTLLPIAQLTIKKNEDLDEFINLVNSDLSFAKKMDAVSSKPTMKVLKSVKAKDGNNLEFRTFAHLPDDCIVVNDLDCAMERTYQIGKKGELEMAEDKVEITSFEQVIEAWESGAVYF